MKNKLLKESLFINKFFVSGGASLTNSSILFSFLRFKSPEISLILGLSSVAVSWYEPIIAKVIPASIVNILPITLMVFALVLADEEKIKTYKIHYWYTAFLLLATLSGMFAGIRGEAGLNAPLYLLILIYFFIAFLWSQSQSAKRIINYLSVLALPAAFYGIWQYLTGNFSYSTSSLEAVAGRSNSFFTSPNVFAMIMVVMFLASFFMIQKFGLKKYYFGIIIFGFALFTTLSRTAWIAAIIGVIPLLNINFFHKGTANLAVMAGLKSRIGVIFSPDYWLNSSIDGRLWAIKNGLYIAKQFPFFGSGPGTYGGRFAEIYTSPVYFYGMQNGYVPLLTTDNQYIAFLVQLGLLGALVFGGFLLSLWLQTYKTVNEYSALTRSILISFLVMMLAANVFEFMAVSIPVAILMGGFLASETV